MFTFEHPGNGYRESVSDWAVLWALLFGPVYLGLRGLWGIAAAEVLAAVGLVLVAREPGVVVVLALVMHVAVALAAPAMLRRRYLRAGWRLVD